MNTLSLTVHVLGLAIALIGVLTKTTEEHEGRSRLTRSGKILCGLLVLTSVITVWKEVESEADDRRSAEAAAAESQRVLEHAAEDCNGKLAGLYTQATSFYQELTQCRSSVQSIEPKLAELGVRYEVCLARAGAEGPQRPPPSPAPSPAPSAATSAATAPKVAASAVTDLKTAMDKVSKSELPAPPPLQAPRISNRAGDYVPRR